MKLTETILYPFAGADVYRMQIDQACREEGARESGAVEYSVSISSEGGKDIVQIDRKLLAEVPDFVKKFTGEYVNARQIETWDAEPDAAGRRVCKVRVTVKGQPASMDATITVSETAEGTQALMEGEVKVAVPFIGRKIEPEIAKAILGAMHIDQRVGIKWLEANTG